MRYKLLTLLDKVFMRHVHRCRTCGRKLSHTELYYYDSHCKICDYKTHVKGA